MQAGAAATTRPANVNKLRKMVFLLAKIVFMSKVLDSRSNDLQRFGRYKEGQKILHEILIQMAIEQDQSGHRTGLLISKYIRGCHTSATKIY